MNPFPLLAQVMVLSVLTCLSPMEARLYVLSQSGSCWYNLRELSLKKVTRPSNFGLLDDLKKINGGSLASLMKCE